MTTNNRSSDEAGAGKGSQSGAAEAVRSAFSALPFDEKVSTLLRIEIDLLGDIAEGIVSTVSKAADEFSRAFEGARPSATGTTNTGGQTPTS